MTKGFIVEFYPHYCEWNIGESILRKACESSTKLISPTFLCLRKKPWSFILSTQLHEDKLRIQLIKSENEIMNFDFTGSFLFMSNSKTPDYESEKSARITEDLSETFVFMKVSTFKQEISNYSFNGLIKIQFLIDAKPVKSDGKTLELFHGFPELHSTTLYNQPDFSDVELIVGDKKFYAHKAILANHSPVFATMFKTDMKESKESIVKINDLSAEVVDCLLTWIYTNKVEFHHDIIYNLSYASEKYQITGLKKLCEITLEKSLTTKNWVEFISTADKYSMENLKKIIIAFIVNHKDILTSEIFKEMENLSKKMVLEIFEYFVHKSIQ
ncbi:hypothetical protein TKK_0005347 [Trichogramma kaykai]|uniref:BTB domain-containing protein n=1 Tax=Trichogramma kaykai TaxID=54128 RepID=A0ABD2XHG6_9HYME